MWLSLIAMGSGTVGLLLGELNVHKIWAASYPYGAICWCDSSSASKATRFNHPARRGISMEYTAMFLIAVVFAILGYVVWAVSR